MNSIRHRVNYYCKLDQKFTLKKISLCNNGHHKTHIIANKSAWFSDMNTTYRYDFLKVLLLFPRSFLTASTMGDVTFVPEVPSVVKSRPIRCENSNSVLLKLDSARHFKFINDTKAFESKKNRLVWRGVARQKHRKDFLERHFSNPLCDVAQVNSPGDLAYGERMSIEEQLNYKFILCIEGNDVATNLKWAMSSNSLCFMPKPKYETWFMEGQLKPGVHYVELADDYSDVDEKINYYSSHADEALHIINKAHQHVALFQDERREDLISMLVMEKYFHLSGQLPDG